MTSASDDLGGRADRLSVAGATTSGGPRSSLAYTDQMEPAKPPLSCPYAAKRVLVELISGTVHADRCRSSRCLYCLPLNARRRALAITLARPARMIRLSLVADADSHNPCALALSRIGLIRRNLKRAGIPPGEWSYTMERNPKGTGYHAHCLQTGMFIDQDELQNACVKAKAGWPHINRIRREGKWTSQYGMKGFGADGYGMKTFRPNADPRDALKINNGRVEHHTRGFFAIEGQPIRVREYERLAIREMNGEQEMAWIACHPSQVADILHDDSKRSWLISDVNRRLAEKLRVLR